MSAPKQITVAETNREQISKVLLAIEIERLRNLNIYNFIEHLYTEAVNKKEEMAGLLEEMHGLIRETASEVQETD